MNVARTLGAACGRQVVGLPSTLGADLHQALHLERFQLPHQLVVTVWHPLPNLPSSRLSPICHYGDVGGRRLR